MAKLKQSKLDVRREQWLSQATVKSEASKVNSYWRVKSTPSSMQIGIADEEGNRSKENVKLISRVVDIEGSSVHENDSLGRHDSAKDLPESSCSSSRCCSESVSEADEDSGSLDDWEAVADALAADDNRNLESSKSTITLPGRELPNIKNSVNNAVKQERKSRVVTMSQSNRRARYPNVNSERRSGQRTVGWGWQRVVPQPSPCPICYEDLDSTDIRFHPCSCGFQLCLFCHKRILETDGRCPGCRKQYQHVAGM